MSCRTTAAVTTTLEIRSSFLEVLLYLGSVQEKAFFICRGSNHDSAVSKGLAVRTVTV